MHEVKFDGYRIQLHKAFRQVIIFTRYGHNWTDRFPRLAAELAALPSCIIDAELMAADAHGMPILLRSSASSASARKTALPSGRSTFFM